MATQDFLDFLEGEFVTVEGWINLHAAAIFDSVLEFQEVNSITGHILEIGAFKGKSACLLARHVRTDEKLFVMDSDLWPSFKEMTEHVRNVDPDAVFICDKSNRLPDRRLEHGLGRNARFIHIDADHSFAETYADIENALPILADDGVVAVDDFFNYQHVQVTAAVYAFLEHHPRKLIMFLAGYNKAYLCRPSAYERYRTWVLRELQRSMDLRGAGDIDLCLSSHYPADSLSIGIGPRESGSGGVRVADWDNTYRTQPSPTR